MELNEVQEGRRYEFTVREGSETYAATGRFICFAYSWWGMPADTDLRIVVIRNEASTYGWRYFRDSDVVGVRTRFN